MDIQHHGLDDRQIEKSRHQYGDNAIPSPAAETFVDKLLNNLRDPLIIILGVALAISVLLSISGFAPWYEGVGIAIAVSLAVLVSSWSEFSNENTFQKLLEEASRIQIKVVRNGNPQTIAIDDLVVDDLVILQSGDTVPADGELVEGHVEVDQAALTGESDTLHCFSPDHPQYSDDSEKLFRSALIVDGEALMRLNKVGRETRYGATLSAMQTTERRLSPLQKKLVGLGRQISHFAYLGAGLIALAFMVNQIFIQGEGLESYLQQPAGDIAYNLVTALVLAIIIIVVAVPEGLPMMIAVTLSQNMRKLLKGNVLVRKLLGIETAGSLTALFTDKTGTLTQGQLMVGGFVDGTGHVHEDFDSIPDKLRQSATFAVRHNCAATFSCREDGSLNIVGGNRTEHALLQYIAPALADDDQCKVVDGIAFNSARKFSAVQTEGQQSLTLVKGAAEVVLDHCRDYLDNQGNQCPLDDREALENPMKTLSEKAMRLIALAHSSDPIENDELPKKLTLIGLFAQRDELRPEAADSVRHAQQAGIQVVMITGDARHTAQAIARDVGILRHSHEKVVTSKDMADMDDKQLKQLLPDLRVVARAFPADKLRLVQTAQSLNWVVGMTGDGVNDAPALKSADVGFAMGSGTEVTREAGDIVILDDNFTSLIRTVLYGRTLFLSVRKFLAYQLSVNMAAILIAFLGPFLGVELPLTMTQLLWINLIMDTLAAIAFAGEPALKKTLKDPPIPKDAPLITREMWSVILFGGTVIALLGLLFINTPLVAGWFGNDEAVLLTAFFAFFVLINNWNKFNVRSDGFKLWEHLGRNLGFIWITMLILVLQVVFTYQGGQVLRTVPLSVNDWLIVLALSLLIIPLDFCRKGILKRLKFQQQA